MPQINEVIIILTYFNNMTISVIQTAISKGPVRHKVSCLHESIFHEAGNQSTQRKASKSCLDWPKLNLHTMIIEVEGMIVHHYTSLTTIPKVFFPDSHPLSYRPRSRRLIIGKQTVAGVSLWCKPYSEILFLVASRVYSTNVLCNWTRLQERMVYPPLVEAPWCKAQKPHVCHCAV